MEPTERMESRSTATAGVGSTERMESGTTATAGASSGIEPRRSSTALDDRGSNGRSARGSIERFTSVVVRKYRWRWFR